jgi:hypothetical protein
MEDRVGTGIFSLHGIGGMLVAVVLLLSILAFLVTTAVGVQNANAQKFYDVKDAHKIEKINTASGAHRIVVGE